MAIKHSGVAAPFWVFLLPRKKLLGKSVFSATAPVTAMSPATLLSAPGYPPPLADTPSSGIREPLPHSRYCYPRKDSLVSATGGDLGVSGSRPEPGRESLGNSDATEHIRVGGGRPARKAPGCGGITHPE